MKLYLETLKTWLGMMKKRLTSKTSDINGIETKHPLPEFILKQDDQGMTLLLKGYWHITYLRKIEGDFEALVKSIKLRTSKLTIMSSDPFQVDTAGAWLIGQALQKFEAQTIKIATSFNSQSQEMINQFSKYSLKIPPTKTQPKLFIKLLDELGYKTIETALTAYNLLNFYGETLVTWYLTLVSNTRIRWVSVVHHIEEVGFKALPIVGLISLLIGMVLAYQGINQLNRFSAEIYTVDFLGIAILREIGVLLTAIVIAGRSGSAFAAQIGTMALNQEIDAIRILGLNPINVLVLPRIIALLVSLPILTFFSMLVGLTGGMIVTFLVIDLPPPQFVTQLQVAIGPNTFWVGMSKAPLFAMIISLVGCFRGMQVKGSAESVGKMTTRSVVDAIFLIIVCDAFMSILFSYLKV